MELKKIVDRYQEAMNTVYRSVNNILKEKIQSDITPDQFSTLQYIRNHDHCTSTDIAQKYVISKSAVTAQINRLHDKGLVERTRDDIDRRNIYLHLTSTGRKFVDLTEEQLYKEISQYLAHFNEQEIHTFISLLEELAHLMGSNQKGEQ